MFYIPFTSFKVVQGVYIKFKCPIYRRKILAVHGIGCAPVGLFPGNRVCTIPPITIKPGWGLPHIFMGIGCATWGYSYTLTGIHLVRHIHVLCTCPSIPSLMVLFLIDLQFVYPPYISTINLPIILFRSTRFSPLILCMWVWLSNRWRITYAWSIFR